jgi:phosphate-selective porin
MGNHLLALIVGFLFVIPATAQETIDDALPPSIHVRDWLTVNLRTKFQFDFGKFRPELDEKQKILLGRRIRFGADGALFRDLDYYVRVETAKGDPELRDVFLKYGMSPSFQIQGGRFKIPFGRDQLTDTAELNFVQRSRIGTLLAPGRDTGAMILGDVLEHKVQYSAGVFRHDGKNSEIEDFAELNERSPGGDHTVAARVTVAPAFQNLKVGWAVARSRVPAGLNTLRGVTVSNQIFFPRMYVNGARQRWGAELSWLLGSLLVRGEFMNVREQRLTQGLHGEDLPALRTRGWYLSATHPLFGHLDNGRPGRVLVSLLPGKGLGLFEATVRYETIHFGSETSAGSLPSRSPRAANVAANDDRVLTLGINWRANHYVKVQFNGVREILSDAVRTPIDGKNQYWTLIGRVQLFF